MATRIWTDPTNDSTYDGDYVSGAGGQWSLRSGTTSYPATLKAYWKLDETSGARVDSTANGHDLSENGAVGFASGKLGNAAHFVNANQHALTRSSGVSSFQ